MKDLFEYYEGEKERCGFVIDGAIFELPNIHPEPTEGFEIDAGEILRYIDQIEAIWHTHPGSSSVLSGADKDYMEMWPKVSHFVVGEDGITEYKVENGVVVNANHIPR